jgi:tricorn protease
MYYVSEQLGTSNVVKLPLASLGDPTKAAKPVAVTNHTDEAVREARISKNGEWIVYECGGDLWVVGTNEEYKPRKVAIEVNADEKSNNERVTTFTSGATEFGLTADEKFAAFAVHGKLFRLAVGPNSRPTQLTFGPSNDHGIAWAPDGSKIIFVSDRNGHDDLYLLTADDPDHPKFTEAHRFKVTRLTDTREAEAGVSFSPDGKRVAFLRGGKLLTMSPDGKDIKTLVAEAAVFDYEWSPDSKWIVFARRDGSFASELYIVPSTGATAADPVRNVTRYATTNAGVTWSADGKRIAFLSDRRGSANLHVLDLEKPAATGAPAARPASTWSWGSKAPLPIDWEDIHLRVKPVIRGHVDEAAISPDGSKIALRDGANNDLWVASSTGGSLTRITTGGVYPRNIQWSKRRNILGGAMDMVYFLDGTGQMRIASVGSGELKPGTGQTAVMGFRVKMNIRQDELFTEMFDQSWRYLSENFYDDKYHGHNWDAVRKTYRPLVKHISMKEDLYALLYLMMGELNASHLGVSGPGAVPEESTAELGLLWDEAYRGKGLKIAEILKRGPADRKGIDLKAGDYVVSIDGTDLDDNTNVARLLNGKAGESVFLQVTTDPNDPKAKKRRVELMGIGRGNSRSGQPGASSLMYDRWVARNAARVAEKSGGKLGYIHIPSMDEDGLDRFVRSLYSDNFDKDAIVLDVRFNGGGFTHDQVLNYLGRKEHTVFKNRDGGTGLVLRSGDRKWHKPLTLLINNRSYSDAEIFPSAFRTLGLGKLVGEPTGGFVIGTSGMRLVDGSTFRIPRIGVYTTAGVNMDKKGVQPDVTVENHPDQLAKGIDAQLDKAVEVLQADVVAWKKKREPAVVVVPKVPEKAAVPVVGPMPMPMPMPKP